MLHGFQWLRHVTLSNQWSINGWLVRYQWLSNGCLLVKQSLLHVLLNPIFPAHFSVSLIHTPAVQEINCVVFIVYHHFSWCSWWCHILTPMSSLGPRALEPEVKDVMGIRWGPWSFHGWLSNKNWRGSGKSHKIVLQICTLYTYRCAHICI